MEALVDLFVEITNTFGERITELERQLNQDSHNSSKPPSGDGPGKKPKESNKPPGKRGGQKGHPGQHLKPVENPDHQVELRLDAAPSGAQLTDADIVGWETRQLFDLPEPKLIVTEYRAAVYRDPVTGKLCHSEFPAGVDAPTGYGAGALGLMVYLHVQQHIPLERVGAIFLELFGQPVSDGTILKARHEVAVNLEEFEEALRASIMVQTVLHCDETGFRIKSKHHRYWLHVMGTEQLTYYAVHDKRGAAIPEIGILPGWKQRLVHDCLSSYDTHCPDALHCLCNPHLVRELTAVSEEGDHQVWAKDLIEFLESSNEAIKERGGTPYTEKEMMPQRSRFESIVERGKRMNPETAREGPEPKKKGRKKRTKAQNLIIRLEKRGGDYLRFMTDEHAPYSNNLAERDLRMMKLQMKISGCFRTLWGAEDFTRIRSYISTLRKNGAQVFDAIKLSVIGSPLKPADIVPGLET